VTVIEDGDEGTSTVLPPVGQRILAAKFWIDSLYQTDGIYGYLKEHPGLPLGIHVKDTGDKRLSGDWRSGLLGWYGVSRVTRVGVTTYEDLTRVGMEDAADLDYDEPKLLAKRKYNLDGSTTYDITLEAVGGKYVIDVYLGNTRLWADVKTVPIGTKVSVTKTGYDGLPCNKYTVRHAARLGQFIYQIWGSTNANYLAKLRSDFGFTYDIYDPLFGVNSALAGNFMFTYQAYPDTFEVWSRLPKGLNPHRYPYYSKVQLSRDAYILQSYTDPLLRMLQAIHYLNKYHTASISYNTGQLGSANVTPDSITHEAWAKWNGVGIGHPQNASIASGVRTATFLALATLMGYRYGVTEWKSVADIVYSTLTGIRAPQAGCYPLSPGWAKSTEDGFVLRPPYHGSFYCLWTPDGATASVPTGTLMTILSNLVDMFNMPLEDSGPIYSNAETTITMIQALRIYAKYALGINYPTYPGGLMP
jgi:hypothetical protein